MPAFLCTAWLGFPRLLNRHCPEFPIVGLFLSFLYESKCDLLHHCSNPYSGKPLLFIWYLPKKFYGLFPHLKMKCKWSHHKIPYAELTEVLINDISAWRIYKTSNLESGTPLTGILLEGGTGTPLTPGLRQKWPVQCRKPGDQHSRWSD